MAEDCDEVKCLHHVPHEHVSVSETEFCSDEHGYCDTVGKNVVCIRKPDRSCYEWFSAV